MVSVVLKDERLYVCWVGRVKSHEEFLLFKSQLNNALEKFIDNPHTLPMPKSKDTTSKPKDEKEITPIQKYTFFRLMLVNAYPFNTHALGFILKLKLNNKYDFDIATDHYRLLSMLEYIEFNKVFTINIDTDPRLTTKGKVLDSQ
ncbi:hypothetical protein [Helicobacter sp. T3_23-1059]